MSGLSRRVSALEATRVDLLYRQEAERLAQEHGGSVAGRLEELRAMAADMGRRFGPQPDMREVARWAAEQRGLDPDEVYAKLLALKEQR